MPPPPPPTHTHRVFQAPQIALCGGGHFEVVGVEEHVFADLGRGGGGLVRHRTIKKMGRLIPWTFKYGHRALCSGGHFAVMGC